MDFSDIDYHTVDPNSDHPCGIPLIHVATMQSDFENLEVLLRRGAYVERKYHGIVPLFFVRYAEAARILIKYDADPDARDPKGHTLLYKLFLKTHNCVFLESIKIAKLLLKTGATAIEVTQTIIHSNSLDFKELNSIFIIILLDKIFTPEVLRNWFSMTEESKLNMRQTMFLFMCYIDTLLQLNDIVLHGFLVSPFDLLIVKTTNVLAERMTRVDINVAIDAYESLLKSIAYKVIDHEMTIYMVFKTTYFLKRIVMERVAVEVLVAKCPHFCADKKIAYSLTRYLDFDTLENVTALDPNAFTHENAIIDKHTYDYVKHLHNIYLKLAAGCVEVRRKSFFVDGPPIQCPVI